MNYYERYCGDYARDTGHLSLQEHGAYTVMLDTYYATETPLPADYKALYRICRAMSAKEQEAVRNVADQFFKIAADGLRHNTRADEEIDEARPRIEAARKNGAKGGRPKKNPIGIETVNPVGLEQEPTGKAPHTPTPTPLTSKALSGKPDFTQDAVEVLNYLNKNTGKNYRPVDSNLKLIVARLKSGVTPLQLREVVFAKCEQWGKDEKMKEYLRPATLFNATKLEQYLGETSGMS